MPCVVCSCQWLKHLPHLLGARPLKSVLQVTSPHPHPRGRCACLLAVVHPVLPHILWECVHAILFPSGFLGISVSPPEVRLGVGEERTEGDGQLGCGHICPEKPKAAPGASEGRAKPWEGRSQISYLLCMSDCGGELLEASSAEAFRTGPPAATPRSSLAVSEHFCMLGW